MNKIIPSSHLDLLALSTDTLTVRLLDNADYQTVHESMLNHTLKRIENKKINQHHADELWIVEHQNVYTLGQASKPEHILYRTDTPIIQTDRGGQVTWHGDGQLVVYWLFELHRLNFGVRDLVSHAEQAIIDIVAHYLPKTLTVKARRDAPGVYIYNHTGDMLGKIASLGFKIKQGFSYHGIAINLINDLSAFHAINPCGYAGMPMAKLSSFGQFTADDMGVFITQLIKNIARRHAGLVELRTQDTLK